MIWVVLFGNRINNKFIVAYYLVAVCFIVAGAWLKLNEDEIANLFLMIGLGLTLDALLMLFFKRKRTSEKQQ